MKGPEVRCRVIPTMLDAALPAPLPHRLRLACACSFWGPRPIHMSARAGDSGEGSRAAVGSVDTNPSAHSLGSACC